LKEEKEKNAKQTRKPPERMLPEKVAGVPKAAEGLVRYDAFRAYLQEIRGFPVLSRQEEHQLAVCYKEQGDMDAAYKLITSNLRLVVAIALKFYGTIHNIFGFDPGGQHRTHAGGKAV